MEVKEVRNARRGHIGHSRPKENERAIQRTILEIAMPESSFAFVLQSDLVEAPEGAEQRSNDPIFQAQVSEKTILEYRKKEEEQRQAQIMEEKRLAEEKAQQEKEAQERQKAMEEERRQQEARRAAEELKIKEQEELDRQKELLQIEMESRQSEDQTDGQIEDEVDGGELAPTVEEGVDAPQEEVETTEQPNVQDASPVSLPDAWSALESAWKSMVNGPVLEAEPTPLRREFESLANQNEDEIILSTGMSTLEEISASVNFLESRNADFALLHCVSEYPPNPEDISIDTISLLKEK